MKSRRKYTLVVGFTLLICCILGMTLRQFNTHVSTQENGINNNSDTKQMNTYSYSISYRGNAVTQQSVYLPSSSCETYDITIPVEGEMFPRNACITFEPQESNKESKWSETVTLPIFTTDTMYEYYVKAAQTEGSILSQKLSVNLFCEDEESVIGCLAYTSVLDEYNAERTRKRHHIGFSMKQRFPNSSGKYVNTSKSDKMPDAVGLLWTIGGATTSDADSSSAFVEYSLQNWDSVYENQLQTEKMDANFYLCIGTGIGYDVPDMMSANDESGRICYPEKWNISAITSWYNVGGYEGRDGVAKGYVIHTYGGKRQSEKEAGWAETKLSPL